MLLKSVLVTSKLDADRCIAECTERLLHEQNDFTSPVALFEVMSFWMLDKSKPQRGTTWRLTTANQTSLFLLTPEEQSLQILASFLLCRIERPNNQISRESFTKSATFGELFKFPQTQSATRVNAKTPRESSSGVSLFLQFPQGSLIRGPDVDLKMKAWAREQLDRRLGVNGPPEDLGTNPDEVAHPGVMEILVTSRVEASRILEMSKRGELVDAAQLALDEFGASLGESGSPSTHADHLTPPVAGPDQELGVDVVHQVVNHEEVRNGAYMP
jgi:hypothetical protein